MVFVDKAIMCLNSLKHFSYREGGLSVAFPLDILSPLLGVSFFKYLRNMYIVQGFLAENNLIYHNS